MAVFTPVSFKQAAKFVASYDIGELTDLQPIEGGVENTNYKISTTTGEFILTLFESRTPKNALPFVFSLLAHLKSNNLPVAQIISDKSHNSLSSLNSRPAAIASFLSGESVTCPSIKHCEGVGLFLADMHIATKGFSQTRSNPFGLPVFGDFFQNISGDVEIIKTGLSDIISNELDFLQAQNLENLPVGIVHADLFPDNVLFNDKDELSGVIDFYYSAIGSFIYDIAIVINCWAGFDGEKFDMNKLNALLGAYQSKRPLIEEEKNALNTMLRIASMRFLLSRANDWFVSNPNQMVAKKDPLEYVRILKFHQQHKNFGEQVF